MPSTSTGKTMMHNHVGFEEDDRDLASNQNPFEIEGSLIFLTSF